MKSSKAGKEALKRVFKSNSSAHSVTGKVIFILNLQSYAAAGKAAYFIIQLINVMHFS